MEAVALPHGEKFKTVWEEWLKDRKERRKPVTSRAAKMQLEKLSSVSEEVAIKTIRRCIEFGYQGIFIDEKDIKKVPMAPTESDNSSEKKAEARLNELHNLHRKGRVSDETYLKVYDWCDPKGMIFVPPHTLQMLLDFYSGDKLKILKVKSWFDHLTETGKRICL